MSGDAQIPSLIAVQLNHLLSHSSPPITIARSWSGTNPPCFLDRFTLLIPFCLDFLRWDLMYDGVHPLRAPDIIFAAEDEDFYPLETVPVEGVEGAVVTRSRWWDWDARDPSLLLELVDEMRELYRLYQKKRVDEVGDPRLKFELSTMSSREGIEVSLMSGSDRLEDVKFAVPLDIVLQVPCCPWEHQPIISLQVVFPVSRNISSAPSPPRLKLVSSSDLKTLFSIEDVALPSWSVDMCMVEYLSTLEKLLNAQVSEAVQSISARRHFIVALAHVFGRPLEADQVFCRRATVLSASGNFMFLIHFSLPTMFPKQRPTLILQSCQHLDSQSAPIVSPPVEYPWSPRWDSVQLAERIFDYLVDDCLKFKKHCNDVLAKKPVIAIR